MSLNNTEDVIIEELDNKVKDSFANSHTCNSFALFKSVAGSLTLVYQSINYNLKIYLINLSLLKKELKINKSCNNYISCISHIIEPSSKNYLNRDLILIGFKELNMVHILEGDFWNCILILKDINAQGYLGPVVFLREDDKICFITSNENSNNINGIQIFNLDGKKEKEINDSRINIFYFEIYSNEKDIFIIAGSDLKVISYDYNKNKIFKEYSDKKDCDEKEYFNGSHYCVKVVKIKNLIQLIDSCLDGNIRIWDFIQGDLIKRIKISNDPLFGICLMNNFLVIGTNQKVVLLSLNENYDFHVLPIPKQSILTIKELDTKNNSFIVQGYKDNNITSYKIIFL